MKSLVGAVVLACSLWFAAPASAVSLQPVAQTRYVEATTQARDALSTEDPIVDSGSDHVDAVDFGPFDATVTASCSNPTLSCPPVSASQTSTIGPSGFTLEASTHAEAYYAHEGLQTGSSQARSVFLLDFVVDQPVDFEIVSAVEWFSFTDGDNVAEWFLFQLGGPFFLESLPSGHPETTYNGTLPMGSYRFQFAAVAEASFSDYNEVPLSFESSTASVTLRLIPEPGAGLLLLLGLPGIAFASRGRSERAASVAAKRSPSIAAARD